jgi:hypothetical protein
VRAIAKAQHCSVAQVNVAIDRWADQAITDKIRKHGSPSSWRGWTNCRRFSISAR